ncbi:MAG: hypothetical protein JNK82_23365 [Myxococcaceae bacterium]|nr:hypothetical protein [Myxococcaceae bacterium]
MILVSLLLAAAPAKAAPAPAAAPAAAHQQGDWFASLYTGEGIELRADERVFALFAMLNAVGYDGGPITRKEPVPKVLYHPVRQQVRQRVIGGDAEVKKVADAFLDAHPVALRRYLAYAASAAPPPFSTGATAKDLQDLKGLEAVLARAWSGWKLDELMGTVQGEYRKVLKSYLSAIDTPMQKARDLLKVPEGGSASVLVVNLLDAQNEVRGVQTDSEIVLVVGPADKPNVEGLLKEYARVMVDPVVSKKVSGWANGAAVLREAQVAGATEQTLQDYASGLVATAVALRAMEANDAAYEAANARGYFGAKDIAALFDGGKTVDAVVADAFVKAEAKRPTAAPPKK